MSITPLCNQVATLALSTRRASHRQHTKTPRRPRKYESPNVFASTLRPLCPQWSQRLVIRARAIPAQCAQDLAELKVSRFKLAPKSRQFGPLDFKDVPKQETVNRGRFVVDNDDQLEARHLLAHPDFLKALTMRKLKKAIRYRRHSKGFKSRALPPHQEHNQSPDQLDRNVKRRSIPFDEDNDLDPWMLFPNLQRPYSALRDDSQHYIRQATEAERARQQRYCVRGSPLSAEELKDMVHMTYSMGKYADISRRMPTTPESIDKRLYSPMDVD